MKMGHCNIAPENIFIADSKWKLAGLNFSMQFTNLNDIIVPFSCKDE